MKFGYRMLANALALAPLAGIEAQARDPLAGFDAYVTRGMQDWKIPGLGVAIVKNDSVVYAKRFGVRTIGRPEKVDENTLFAIASDTKSFTGIVLAMLVERASFDSMEAKDQRDKTRRKVGGTRPSLALARYAGAYADSLYGRAEVRMENGHLVLALAPKQIGDLDHWHFDTFKVTWRDDRDGWNLVTFVLDTEGKVDMLRTDIGGLPEEWPVMKRLPDATPAASANGK